jgi:peptidoglycan hydrolase-like protein with peptidoglycan-binding domain
MEAKMTGRRVFAMQALVGLAFVAGASAAHTAMPVPPAIETARVILVDTPVDEMAPQSALAYMIAIQGELAAHGYRPGPIDGVMGSQTRLAIEAYQGDAGLPVTGVATKELLDHLKFAQPKVFASSSPGGGLDPALVREVQIELAERGYYHGEMDGIAGKGTRQAVRDFQFDAGLDVTGTVDQNLLGELRLASPDITASPLN